MGEALAPYREKIVPCHNDLVPENVMDDGYRVLLIDFDYSGNNDPCFDLGSISTEAGYDDSQVRELARAYYGLVSEKIVARIHLHSILGDVGWSLWSVIQAENLDIDIDFNEYGLTRWNRAVERMESGEFERWLRKVRSKKSNRIEAIREFQGSEEYKTGDRSRPESLATSMLRSPELRHRLMGVSFPFHIKVRRNRLNFEEQTRPRLPISGL